MRNAWQHIHDHWGIITVMMLCPLLMLATIPILPTHDDWAGTTKPDFNPFFIKEHFLFYGYHWRPFDTWIGYIVGRNPQVLYPALNHILVVMGHTIATMLVQRLTRVLGYGRQAAQIAMLFFFLLPATMATVLAVDSQNQVFAMVWGITAFLAYVKLRRGKYILWPLLVFIATLSKENGLMWALICPILAFGYDIISLRMLKRDLAVGIGIMAVYALAVMLLPRDIIIHPEYVPEEMKVVKNVVKFLFTTFITADYIYLLHQPSRNLPLALLSLLPTVPFMYFVFIKKAEVFRHKKMLCVALCLLIAVGPHLLTIFSMMHTYAGLSLLAVMVAHGIDSYKHLQKPVIGSFVLFMIAALLIDSHLWQTSVASGRVGKRMAREAIRQTGQPANSVYVIIIKDDYPKLSSFCVIPNEAFGWGLASRHETNYKWPESIQDTTIARTPQAMDDAHKLSLKVLKNEQYDCVWIVDHDEVDVVKR